MPESLLHKYPHLKLLLSESREKKTSLNEGNQAVNKTESLSQITNDASDEKADDLIHKDKSTPRKSILGPGVGPRNDRNSSVKTLDSNNK